MFVLFKAGAKHILKGNKLSNQNVLPKEKGKKKAHDSFCLRQMFKQHSSFRSFKNNLAAGLPMVITHITNKGQATDTELMIYFQHFYKTLEVGAQWQLTRFLYSV